MGKLDDVGDDSELGVVVDTGAVGDVVGQDLAADVATGEAVGGVDEVIAWDAEEALIGGAEDSCGVWFAPLGTHLACSTHVKEDFLNG